MEDTGNDTGNLVDSYIASMEALKVSVHGKLYFVPRKNIHMVDTFEVFIETINIHNVECQGLIGQKR